MYLYKLLYLIKYFFKYTTLNKVIYPQNPPCIINGLYRSGTTLTTKIVQKLGIDLGSEDHICKSIGSIAHLNPDGFRDNFFFNDLGQYILYYCKGSGIDFPSEKKLRSLNIKKFSNCDFSYYSEIIRNDDRIDPFIRKGVLLKYGIAGVKNYVNDNFNTKNWGFQDVHSGVYMFLYNKIWNNCKFVCVFRDPDSFLKSAKKLSDRVNYFTWIEYYNRALNYEKQENIFWLHYNSLLNNENNLLYSLQKFLSNKHEEIGEDKINIALKLIDKSKVHFSNSGYSKNNEAEKLYSELITKSVHSIQKHNII